MTTDLVPGTVTTARRTKKMRSDCALYRAEKVGDREYYTIREYCDGLEDAYCGRGKSCPFYKWKEKWRPIVVRKQTQYVRIEE